MVLGCGTDHGWSSDVDLLNTVIETCAGGNRLSKWVEIDHDQLEGGNLQFLQLTEVILLAGVRQNSGMDLRVQGLHTAFEALRETGDFLNRGNRDTEIGNFGRRGSGGHDLHASVVECPGQILQVGLVIHTDQCALNCLTIIAHEGLASPVELYATLSAGNFRIIQDFYNEFTLYLLDPFMQACFIIPPVHRDRFLCDDRPGIHTGIHNMDGGTRHPHPIGQGIPDSMCPRERRQESRVGIDDAGREPGQEVLPENLHEPCGDNQIR